MSTVYIVLPLDGDCAAWLDEYGVSHPPASANYRTPTLAEVEQVLSDLEGYEFTITRCNQGWYVVISATATPGAGPWTELDLSDECNWVLLVFVVDG